MKVKLYLTDDYLNDNIQNVVKRLDNLLNYFESKLMQVQVIKNRISKLRFYSAKDLYEIESLEEEIDNAKKDLPF